MGAERCGECGAERAACGRADGRGEGDIFSSIWELHAAQEILESRVRTQRVDPGGNFVCDEILSTLVKCLVEVQERFVLFSQVEVENPKCVRRNMLANRTSL